MSVRLTTEEFIERATKLHGDTYDYTKVTYTNNTTKINITCNIHGIFTQAPYSHLRGKGCPTCGRLNQGNTKKSNTGEYWIKKVKKIHPEYDFSKTVYTGRNEKVTFCCPIHGEKQASARNLVEGWGCTECAKSSKSELCKGNNSCGVFWTHTNWVESGLRSRGFTCFKVYLIKCTSESETFFKIGKTFTPIKYRFSGKKNMPYEYEIIEVFEGSVDEGLFVSKLEKKLHKHMSDYKYLPKLEFKGMYECFTQPVSIKDFLDK